MHYEYLLCTSKVKPKQQKRTALQWQVSGNNRRCRMHNNKCCVLLRRNKKSRKCTTLQMTDAIEIWKRSRNKAKERKGESWRWWRSTTYIWRKTWVLEEKTIIWLEYFFLNCQVKLPKTKKSLTQNVEEIWPFQNRWGPAEGEVPSRR